MGAALAYTRKYAIPTKVFQPGTERMHSVTELELLPGPVQVGVRNLWAAVKRVVCPKQPGPGSVVRWPEGVHCQH